MAALRSGLLCARLARRAAVRHDSTAKHATPRRRRPSAPVKPQPSGVTYVDRRSTVRVAVVALLLTALGSAFVVKKGPEAQQRCRPGAILGNASVTDRAVRSGVFPTTYS